ILRESGSAVIPGGNFDSWDLGIHGGLFGGARVRAASMRLGQLIRFRAWPKAPPAALIIFFTLVASAGFAALDGAWVAAALLALSSGILGFLIYADCAFAMSQWRQAVDLYVRREDNLSMVAESVSATTQ